MIQKDDFKKTKVINCRKTKLNGWEGKTRIWMIEKGNQNFFFLKTRQLDNFYDKWKGTNHKKWKEAEKQPHWRSTMKVKVLQKKHACTNSTCLLIGNKVWSKRWETKVSPDRRGARKFQEEGGGARDGSKKTQNTGSIKRSCHHLQVISSRKRKAVDLQLEITDTNAWALIEKWAKEWRR